MSYLDLARGRYSCREFEDRAVEQAVVDAIIEAGRIAPSACNNHPSRVMVLDTPELLEKAAACQPRFARDGSIFGAPLIFLICSVTEDAWVRPYDQMNSSEIDTSIVCDQMMMEATEQGLGTRWVCHFKPEVAQEPAMALEAGEDGLVFYRALAQHYKNALCPGGALVLEIGWQQREAVTALLAENGWAEIRCIQDFGGRSEEHTSTPVTTTSRMPSSA